MTKKQETARLYICNRFNLDNITFQNIDPDTVQITDGNGETMRFTADNSGNILDADTGEIIAESNGIQDPSATEITEMPITWTDKPAYFCR